MILPYFHIIHDMKDETEIHTHQGTGKRVK